MLGIGDFLMAALAVLLRLAIPVLGLVAALLVEGCRRLIPSTNHERPCLAPDRDGD